MQPNIPECQRCGLPMEAGYLVDHGHGAAYPTAWVEGVPKWSHWVGLKLKGKTKMPVTTYRCPQCGRLDSFAQPGKWPG
jgi:hypothetical protein